MLYGLQHIQLIGPKWPLPNRSRGVCFHIKRLAQAPPLLKPHSSPADVGGLSSRFPSDTFAFDAEFPDDDGDASVQLLGPPRRRPVLPGHEGGRAAAGAPQFRLAFHGLLRVWCLSSRGELFEVYWFRFITQYAPWPARRPSHVLLFLLERRNSLLHLFHHIRRKRHPASGAELQIGSQPPVSLPALASLLRAQSDTWGLPRSSPSQAADDSERQKRQEPKPGAGESTHAPSDENSGRSFGVDAPSPFSAVDIYRRSAVHAGGGGGGGGGGYDNGDSVGPSGALTATASLPPSPITSLRSPRKRRVQAGAYAETRAGGADRQKNTVQFRTEPPPSSNTPAFASQRVATSPGNPPPGITAALACESAAAVVAVIPRTPFRTPLYNRGRGASLDAYGDEEAAWPTAPAARAGHSTAASLTGRALPWWGYINTLPLPDGSPESEGFQRFVVVWKCAQR